MIGKLVGKVAAAAAVLGWLMTAGLADAAPKKRNKAAGGAAVTGMVVRANGKPVGKAHVRVAAAGGHHHKHAHVHVKRVGQKLKKHRGHAHVGHHRAAHASAMTGPRGHFTIRSAGGAVTLVAHKRGVGTGRVRTVAGGNNVTIALHKRAHAHSGMITAHARKAVHRRVAHKKAGAGQHPANKRGPGLTPTPGKGKPQSLRPGG